MNSKGLFPRDGLYVFRYYNDEEEWRFVLLWAGPIDQTPYRTITKLSSDGYYSYNINDYCNRFTEQQLPEALWIPWTDSEYPPDGTLSDANRLVSQLNAIQRMLYTIRTNAVSNDTVGQFLIEADRQIQNAIVLASQTK